MPARPGLQRGDALLVVDVRRVFVGGLATDYCVLHTVIDAISLGLAVVVLQDAVAAVDLQPGDGDRALARMRERGAVLEDGAALAAAPQVGPASIVSANARIASE